MCVAFRRMRRALRQRHCLLRSLQRKAASFRRRVLRGALRLGILARRFVHCARYLPLIRNCSCSRSKMPRRRRERNRRNSAGRVAPATVWWLLTVVCSVGAQRCDWAQCDLCKLWRAIPEKFEAPATQPSYVSAALPQFDVSDCARERSSSAWIIASSVMLWESSNSSRQAQELVATQESSGVLKGVSGGQVSRMPQVVESGLQGGITQQRMRRSSAGTTSARILAGFQLLSSSNDCQRRRWSIVLPLIILWMSSISACAALLVLVSTVGLVADERWLQLQWVRGVWV